MAAIQDSVVAQGWVVKRNRGGVLGGQVWRYLLFRARRSEGRAIEMKGFYADDRVGKPAALPHDLHWLILTTSTTGAYSSFAFGAELPRVVRLAKRLTEFGVPFGRLLVEGSSPGRALHTPSGPALFAGYCEKKGGGTSLFGSEAFKRRFFVIQPPSPGVLSPSGTLSYYTDALASLEESPLKPPLSLALYDLVAADSAADDAVENHLHLRGAAVAGKKALVLRHGGAEERNAVRAALRRGGCVDTAASAPAQSSAGSGASAPEAAPAALGTVPGAEAAPVPAPPPPPTELAAAAAPAGAPADAPVPEPPAALLPLLPPPTAPAPPPESVGDPSPPPQQPAPPAAAEDDTSAPAVDGSTADTPPAAAAGASSSTHNFEYANTRGLLTFEFEALADWKPGHASEVLLSCAAAAQTARRMIHGAAEEVDTTYRLRVELVIGQRAFATRPVAPSYVAAMPVDQSCRVWLREAEEGYIATLNLLADKLRAAGAPETFCVGRAFLDLARLKDGAAHRLRFVLHEPAAAAGGATQASAASPLGDGGSALSSDGSGFSQGAADGGGFSQGAADGGGGGEEDGVAAAAAKPALAVEEVAVDAALAGLPSVAVVTMTARYQPRAAVERWFFDAVLQNFDADGNGTLCATELLAMMHALGQQDMGMPALEALFRRLDADGSGSVDRKELLAWLGSKEFQSLPMGANLLAFLADGAHGLRSMLHGVSDISSGGDASRAHVLVAQENSHGAAGRGKSVKDSLRVFQRSKGLIVSESVPKYIKLALHLVHESGRGSALMSSEDLTKTLAAMSAQEGKAFDKPVSRHKIHDFVKTYSIDTSEVLKPLHDFRCFNDFFARELKPSARPVAAADDDSVIVSPADCRVVAFPTLAAAAQIWVKGAKFTVAELLGPCGAGGVAPLFDGGSLVVARLAPQDFHRWHVPVAATLGAIAHIDGAVYPLVPGAVHAAAPTGFVENKRAVVLLHTHRFGVVALVAVGSTMVGSVNVVGKEGDVLGKGACNGFFSFGGSTVLLLFQAGAIVIDDDIASNSQSVLETLVRAGEKIAAAAPGAVPGRFAGSPASPPPPSA